MNYKDMKIEDIIDWCKENGQDKVDWLKEFVATPIPSKDKKKNPILNEDGTPVTHTPTFIEIKLAFCDKYMKEIAPKRKPKKPSMYDLIAKL